MVQNPVRVSARFIAERAKYIKINIARAKEIAFRIAERKISIPQWSPADHFVSKLPEETATYTIILDSVNFCFWAKKGERWKFKISKDKIGGSRGSDIAFCNFFKKNPVKRDLGYFSRITFREFKSIYQGGRRLQFLRERWLFARAVSSVILRDFGSAVSFISAADGCLARFVPMAAELPSFGDEAKYSGRKIYFWKRAQILGADLMGAFGNRGIGKFKDPEYLTAFADYRVPQVLREFGVLEYSQALSRKISRNDLIPAGSAMEVEIRACAVQAVEIIARELARLGKKIMPYQVDWALWELSKKMEFTEPHHRTPTVFY